MRLSSPFFTEPRLAWLSRCLSEYRSRLAPLKAGIAAGERHISPVGMLEATTDCSDAVKPSDASGLLMAEKSCRLNAVEPDADGEEFLKGRFFTA